MNHEHHHKSRLFSLLLVSLFLGATLNILIPLDGPWAASAAAAGENETPWWDDTRMDNDRNHRHDALDLALELGEFVEDGRISVLVDFDHVPTEEDERNLERIAGFEPAYRFHWINIISGSVEVERIDETLDAPGAVFLTLNGPVEVMLDESVPEHHVDYVWNLGYTGEGMNIAVIDTGIVSTHVGLDDFDDNPLTNDPKIIAFYDAVNTPDEKDGSTQPKDGHGHGSHCAGIAAGTGAGSENNRYRGVAPGAALIGVKVLSDGGGGTFDQVMAGMEWCVDNREKFNIRAATMSLGGVWAIELTQQEEERLTTMANTMVREGIALTIAAGNSFVYGTIGTPGAARDVITVGATNKNRGTAEYSSRGPTAEGLIKPNVAAIGSNVMSVDGKTSSGYTSMSGTSMATPMVAGIMSLMLQANPDLDPLSLRDLLEYTSEFRWVTHPVRPNNDYGWGFVEADAALEEAVKVDPNLNITIDPETPTKIYVGNETEGNATRYLARQGDDLIFFVEGNASHLEWRPVNGSGWQMANQEDSSMMLLAVHAHGFTTGNHSIWVRTQGPNGVSSPLHILLHVEEAQPKDDDESGFLALDGLPILVVAVGAAFGLRRRRK